MSVTEVGVFDAPFDMPFYGGGASVDASLVNLWPVTLDGMGFDLDDRDVKLRFRSVPQQRAAQDIQDTPGKGTLNPEAFWRRRFEDWRVGAGQEIFDAEDASPFRFRRSRGINVWERNQISLLNSVDPKLIGASNMRCVVAGDFLYVIDNTVLRRTADITPDTPTFTTITGVPGTAPTVIASDGFNVLTAHAASGIYKTTRGAATTASHITGTVDHVSYGKGRWIATNDNVIYDITTLVAPAGPVALPAAFFTHPNTDFAWNSFAEGPQAFYVGGYSGDKSLIYRLTMKEDGTGLNQPVVAGFLPDGELIQSMQGYLGFVLIGTSRGVRMGIPGGNADLTIGALIETDQAVRCFEGQDKFVWFGWSNFENTHYGLGRLSLETFSDPDALAPAYATDLMQAGTGDTTSVVTFQERRVWTVDAGGGFGGLVAEDVGVLEATGEIDTGRFDYGLTDEKLSLFVDMTHISHDGGTHSVYLSTDRDDFALLATHTTEHQPIATGETMGREFELRIELERSGSDSGMGPVVRAWALRVQPVAPVTQMIECPFLLAPFPRRQDGYVDGMNVREKVERIKTLCENKSVVVFTRGSAAWSVIVQDYDSHEFDEWFAVHEELGTNITCNTLMKVVS